MGTWSVRLLLVLSVALPWHTLGYESGTASDVSPASFFLLALHYGGAADVLSSEKRAAIDRNGDGWVDHRDLWDFQAAWLALRKREAGL